jgi:hypothetical protein
MAAVQVAPDVQCQNPSGSFDLEIKILGQTNVFIIL